MITSDTCATTDLVLWELSEQIRWICRLGYILSPSLAPAERNYLVHHFQLREVEGWKSAWQGYCPPSSLLDAGQPLLVPATIQLLTGRKLHKQVSGSTYVQTDTVPLLASGQKYLVWMDMQICNHQLRLSQWTRTGTMDITCIYPSIYFVHTTQLIPLKCKQIKQTEWAVNLLNVFGFHSQSHLFVVKKWGSYVSSMAYFFPGSCPGHLFGHKNPSCKTSFLVLQQTKQIQINSFIFGAAFL